MCFCCCCAVFVAGSLLAEWRRVFEGSLRIIVIPVERFSWFLPLRLNPIMDAPFYASMSLLIGCLSSHQLEIEKCVFMTGLTDSRM